MKYAYLHPMHKNYQILKRPSLTANNARSLHKPSTAQPDAQTHPPSMAHIHSLPPEVLNMIFAYFMNLTNYSGFGKFDPTLFEVAQVCKYWFKTVDSLIFPCTASYWLQSDADVASYEWVFLAQYLGVARRSCLRIRAEAYEKGRRRDYIRRI